MQENKGKRKMVKCKCKYCHKEFEGINLSYEDRQKLLKEKIKQTNSQFITEMREYPNLETAWNFILQSCSEGIIIKTDNKDYKCKLLQNEKIEIVAHIVGKEKGCFLLANGSKVSGTSIQIVTQVVGILQRGNKAIAEISFSFKTKTGAFFHPRISDIIEVENTKSR